MAEDQLNHENGDGELEWFPLTKVKSAKYEWLWPGRIAFGGLTMLDGAKGLGKSSIAAAVAAEISGGPRLFGGKPLEGHGVVWLCTEMSLGGAIKPRLKAAGAKINRCICPGSNRDYTQMVHLTFPADLDRFEKGIKSHHIRGFILDPLSRFVTRGFDLNNEQQAREVLEGLNNLARRTGAAGLLLRHLRKTGGGPALNQGLGSAAIAAVTRVCLRVDPHPERKDIRCLSVVASNDVAKAKTLLFSIEKAGPAMKIKLEGESDEDAEDLAQGQEDAGKKDARKDAKKLLKTILKHGPVPATEIDRQRRELLVSDHALRDAKAELGVTHGWKPGANPSVSLWHPPKGGFPKDA